MDLGNRSRIMAKPVLNTGKMNDRYRTMKPEKKLAVQPRQPTKLSIFQYIISLILGLEAELDETIGDVSNNMQSMKGNDTRVPLVFTSSSSSISSNITSSSTTTSTLSSESPKLLESELMKKEDDLLLKKEMERAKRQRLLDYILFESWKGGRWMLQLIKRQHCDDLLKERLGLYISATQGKIIDDDDSNIS